MVLRIHNVGGWNRVKPGEAFKLRADKRRAIQIDFNAEADTAVTLVDQEGVHTFLAAFRGLQSVWFVAGRAEPAVEGEVIEDLIISPDSEGDVWYRTVDGDTEHYSSTAESFVKVANRRARNPELELMMFKQAENERRRDLKLAAAIAEMEKRMSETAEPLVQSVRADEEEAANDNIVAAEAEASAGPDSVAPVAGGNGAKPTGKVRGKQAAANKGGTGADA